MVSQVANWIGMVSGMATEYYPAEINAIGVCLTMMTSRLGIAIGSNLIGPLLPLYCDILFFVFAAFILLGILVIWFFPRGKK